MKGQVPIAGPGGEAVAALSTSARWPHPDEDWAYLFPPGDVLRVTWVEGGAAGRLSGPGCQRLVFGSWPDRGVHLLEGTVLAPAGGWPLADASVDGVSIELSRNAGVETDLASSVREARRVLRRGGVVHVGIPHRAAGSRTAGGPGVLARWVRIRRVLALVRRAGFPVAECFVRLPGYERSRYFVAHDDWQGVAFVLRRLPTWRRLSALQTLAVVLVSRVSGAAFAAASPGVSIVGWVTIP